MNERQMYRALRASARAESRRTSRNALLLLFVVPPFVVAVLVGIAYTIALVVGNDGPVP